MTRDAVEPTAAEIEAALAAAWRVKREWPTPDWAAPKAQRDADNAAQNRDLISAALAAALPLIEARLREQIAAEIEASPREGQYAPDWHAAGRRAAKIARGA